MMHGLHNKSGLLSLIEAFSLNKLAIFHSLMWKTTGAVDNIAVSDSIPVPPLRKAGHQQPGQESAGVGGGSTQRERGATWGARGASRGAHGQQG